MTKKDKIELKNHISDSLVTGTVLTLMVVIVSFIYIRTGMSLLDFMVIFITLGIIYACIIFVGLLFIDSIREIIIILLKYKIIMVIPKGDDNENQETP